MMPKNALPTLAWNQFPAPDIHAVEPLGAGDFCICYLINETHVLRLAKHEEASAALRRELRLLPQLAEHVSISIPRPEGNGLQLETGEQFLYYPLVRGTTLEPEVLYTLAAECQAALAQQMAEFVIRLHSFPVETARDCGLPEKNLPCYLPDLLERARIALAPRLDTAVWQYYQRLGELYRETPELHAYTPTLLHGDLSPGHFLADLRHCALIGVIDFGDSVIGDPHWDLIFLLEDYGREFFELFLSFYAAQTQQQVSHRVRLFQQLSNVEYCLSQLTSDNQTELEEAIHTLVTQATTRAID
jgi:aminoglycoside 2''-phosphotransferase